MKSCNRPSRGRCRGRAVSNDRSRRVVQIPDTEAPSYELQGDCAGTRLSQHAVCSPDEEGAAIGFIAVTRVQPGAFAEHHVQLLRTFADQAVIAIENVRLFEEVQAAHARSERIAAAADRHRRRAQGHQPLGVRSADGARHAGRVGGAALRGRHGGHHTAEGRRSTVSRRGSYGSHREFMECARSEFRSSRNADRHRARRCSTARSIHIARRAGRSGIHASASAERWATSAPCLGVPLLREGEPIGVLVADAPEVAPVHRQADRTGRRPSPTRP